MTVYNALMTARLGSYHLAPAVICSDAKFSKKFTSALPHSNIYNYSTRVLTVHIYGRGINTQLILQLVNAFLNALINSSIREHAPSFL
jgi:hypothetical protein